MKLRSVIVNPRKKQLELVTRAGRVLPIPFAKLDPPPSTKDPVAKIFIDPELAREAATYILRSGKEGAVHVHQALDYNGDPNYLGDLAMHNLTVEACNRLKVAGLSHRELARRLGTSVTQVYRLLDTANYSKSFKQLLALLHVLGCDVQFRLKPFKPVGKSRTGSRQRAAA